MKKNLFLLFAIYFFVIQSRIIAFLWNDTRFFALGIINLGVILIVILSYSYFEKSNKKGEDESAVSFKKERESVLLEKSHKKPNYKNKLFWISLVFAIIAFVFFKGYLFSNKLIIAAGIGFIIFMALFYIAKCYQHNKFLKLRNTRVYLIIFILGLIVSGFDAMTPSLKQETAVGCIINVVSNGGKYTEQDLEKTEEIYKPEETVIIENNSGTMQEQTGTITTGYTEAPTTDEKIVSQNYLNDGDITILDAIKYLLSENNITLDTKQNVKFTYISYQNPNYPYFKTAFMKKMIGTSTNPDKKIICQTYIVMKGISESRYISTTTNPLQAYRDKADELGKLNGCERNKYITIENL
ncbi:MAG: hypothetical protein WAZ12_03890 [Candidatus Absconditicoccaceae bacterium]